MDLVSNIKASVKAAFAGVQPGETPPWIERLQPAKYWSPSGIEIDFIFLDLNFYVPLKTASFSNVDGDGAYIQHNGLGGARFPMLMIFTGVNNDELARIALKALTETGDGTLYHPVVGTIYAVPSGELEQINAFVTEANQTSIVVEFLETTGLALDGDPPFQSAISAYTEAAALSFEDSVKAPDKVSQVSLGQKVIASIKQVKKALAAVSDGVAETQEQMDDAFDSINGAIDTLVKDPLMLARQVQNLVMAPAYEISMVRAKMDAYKNMALDIFAFPTEAKNIYENRQTNNAAVDRLISGAATAAMAQSSTGSDAEYRSDIVSNQNDLSDALNNFSDWSDANSVALGTTNDSGDFGALSDLLSVAVNDMTVKISSAKTQIKMTTTYDRPMIKWCYELTGSAKPDALTLFQNRNNLGGDEIFIIEAGRELVYDA